MLYIDAFANNLADSQERLSFLEGVAKKVNNPNSQDAYVYATVAVATVKLELKDLEGARKDLDKAEKLLDNFDSVETIVHAAFYRVNAEYYQVSCWIISVGSRCSNRSSQNWSSHPITETLYFIWPASTSRISPPPSERAVHTI
jgi:hypothetical protein